MPKSRKDLIGTNDLYLLLAVALLAVPSVRAVALLGRRPLVVAGCRLGGLARGGGRGLALAVTLLLVVAARGVALVLLAVPATVPTAVAALLLLVVPAAVALLAAVPASVATATALNGRREEVDEPRGFLCLTSVDGQQDGAKHTLHLI